MNKPFKKFRDGAVSLTVWKNKQKSKETNEEVEFFNFTIEKSYKVKDEWKKTSSLMSTDLLKVQQLIQRAYQELNVVNVEIKVE